MRSKSPLLVLVSAVALHAQAPAPAAFEAASVKLANRNSQSPNAAPDAAATLRGGPGSADPNRISWTNITLQSLLISAYGSDCRVQASECDQVTGPAWIRSERYDVNATLPPGTTNEQFSLMLQGLLAERFHVAVHREPRELQGYELVAGKLTGRLAQSPDATPGEAAGSPSGPMESFGAPGTYPKLLRPGFMIAPYRPAALPPSAPLRAVANHLFAREQTPADIAKMLGILLGSHVVDKTGLMGEYDFTLDWVPNPALLADAPPDAPEANLPRDIPTAIQEQLGLRLSKAKLTLDVVVMKNADRVPTEN